MKNEKTEVTRFEEFTLEMSRLKSKTNKIRFHQSLKDKGTFRTHRPRKEILVFRIRLRVKTGNRVHHRYPCPFGLEIDKLSSPTHDRKLCVEKSSRDYLRVLIYPKVHDRFYVIRMVSSRQGD